MFRKPAILDDRMVDNERFYDKTQDMYKKAAKY